MIGSFEIPAWLALVVAVLALAGSLLTLIGSIGLVRLRTFYERVHPPTMGSTLGIGLVLAGSMLLFTVVQGRAVLHELLLGAFVTLTTPVTFMLLVRAARHRDAADAAEAAGADGPEPAGRADPPEPAEPAGHATPARPEHHPADRPVL